jgi:fatty-acyl-CoA synthase
METAESARNLYVDPSRRAPHAFVLQGARTDERELREFARANLAHFKAPHTVTFVKELANTATGKIQKYVLRAQRSSIAPQSVNVGSR